VWEIVVAIFQEIMQAGFVFLDKFPLLHTQGKGWRRYRSKRMLRPRIDFENLPERLRDTHTTVLLFGTVVAVCVENPI